jgi:hypothetical protein
MKNIQRFSLVLFWVLAFLMAVHALLYLLSFNPEYGFLAGKAADIKASTLWRVCFYLHLLGGLVATVIGPFQFVRKFRQAYRATHRQLGKVYVGVILVSSILALNIAFYADGGIMGKAGFTGLALAWFITTFVAYHKIRAGKISEHENWMIRSYAVTFAAVSFRFIAPLGLLSGLAFMEAYALSTWLCWIVNLAVAEVIIRRKQQPRVLRSRQAAAKVA